MEEYVDKKDLHDWTSKYKPRKITEIHGNQTAVKNIVEWLDTFNANAKLYRGKGKKKKIVIKSDKDTSLDGGDSDNSEINIEEKIELIGETMTKKVTKKVNKAKSCIIVTGNHGVGKTSTIQCILENKGYSVNMINFMQIAKMKDTKEKEPKKTKRTKKDKTTKTVVSKDTGKISLNDFVEKTMKGKNIYDLVTGEKKKKMAIVIDEIESIITPIEKTFIGLVLKQNENVWACPIIFIANNHHTKVINIIKANAYEIKMQKPQKDDMINLMSLICYKEKIILKEQDLDELLQKIIEHSQHDYRRLIYILQDIKTLYPKIEFSLGDFKEYSCLAKKKDTDPGIFETTNLLIHHYNGIDDTMRQYETDKVLMPLMMQQNYITILGNSRKINKTELAEDVSQSLIEGDLIENYIYGNQNWDLQEVHGFLSCTYPSFLLSNFLNPTKQAMSGFYTFPLDLNRTSIKKINYTKNIVSANQHFKNMDISDYIYLNKIIRTLIETNNIDECNKLFEGYKCTSSAIESVLKIDKIKGSKYVIPNSAKKKFVKYEELIDED